MGKVFEAEDFIIRTTAQEPENPPTGQLTIFAKADGLYTRNSAGATSKIDASVAGTDKAYRATLTGANGVFTSATVGRNDLSAAIVWAYVSEGVYTGTLVGAFTADKTNFTIALGTATGGVIPKIVRTSADVVTLSSFAVDGITASDFIGTLDVGITVAP